MCLWLLGVNEAAAAPSWLELRWPELAGCPTQVEVEAATHQLTDGEAPQPVTAEAVLTADAAGYSLQLRVRDAGGVQQRTLKSPRCEALADATAVILAVAAAPLGVAARLVAVPPPPRIEDVARDPPPPRIEDVPPPPRIEDVALDPAPPSSAPEPLSPPASMAAPSPRRPGLALGFGVAAGIGPTKRFGAGLSGNLALLWRRARLDLRGSGWFPSAVSIPSQPTAGADLQLAAGALRGGPRFLLGTLALELSGGLELGALRASGFGLAHNERSRGLWAAGLLALGLQSRPLRWLSLGLEVEGLVAFTRRRYSTTDGGVFYRVPPLGLRLGGGIAVHFF
jgi:hypothetical protein